jgi:predicted dehydrogenase
MVGAGYFARFQAEAWKRVPGVDVVAVADLAPGKARRFAADFGFERSYESAERMIDEEALDFIDVATRPESHLELARLAASRGVHAICQKPMAPSWSECVSMVEACERAGVRLLIHENWRWQPWYREAGKLLDAGRVGRPFQLSFFWRTGDGRGPEPYVLQPYFRAMPRLLVYETLVHVLDTFRFLGGEIASVACLNRRVNPAIVAEDQSLIQLAFQGGALGLIDGNRIQGAMPPPIAMGSLLVEGDAGALRMSPDGRLWLSALGGEEVEHAYAIPAEGYRGDSVRATQEHLVSCLRDGRPSESDGRDYLRTVALVEACYRSDASGRAVAPEEIP